MDTRLIKYKHKYYLNRTKRNIIKIHECLDQDFLDKIMLSDDIKEIRAKAKEYFGKKKYKDLKI